MLFSTLFSFSIKSHPNITCIQSQKFIRYLNSFLYLEVYTRQLDNRSLITRATRLSLQSHQSNLYLYNMKVAAAATLLFATLALASPAPAPAAANAAAVAQPLEVIPRDAAPMLEARKKKPKGGSSNSSNSTATMMSPSRALQLGALSLGVMEIVRLW
jgi:hypothetical protein